VRIRQIELVGFKSFREPTKVTLLPGLNAIVGPNGCGKSNIADAIRWVLGEQSVKHLRAKEMEDVIFGGNETSAALGMAEVTLSFEQADEASLGVEGPEDGLAAQIARLSEFTVTRRIYRSGESQYLINQSPARLRDITDLFLGSGVGPKAYAMIEQGRVSQIVQAKPEELRLFIEEAAGTTRFRNRKITSERKLERTRENLARVNDVMREIERQLAALRRQAKRAEEYRRVQDELVSTELALAAHRFGALAEAGERVGRELAELREQLAALQQELREHEVARDEAQRQERAAQEEIEIGLRSAAESGAEVVRAAERRAATRDVVAGLEARIGRIREEGDEIERRDVELAEAARDAEAMKAEAGDLVRRADEALARAEEALRGAAPELERRLGEHADALAALNEQRNRAAVAAARRIESSARLEDLRNDRTRIADRAELRQGELEQVRSDLEVARATQQGARELHDRLEDSRRRAGADLRGREESLRGLEDHQSGLREAIVHVRGRLEVLRELERAYSGYAEGIGTVMGLETPPRALLVDVLEIPAELEPAAAAALGEVLQGAVVDEPAHGARIAEHLRSAGEGRVSLVPVQGRTHDHSAHGLPEGTARLVDLIVARPGYERLRDALFGHVVLAEDLASAVAGWHSHGNGYLWVTRAGDCVDAAGVVTGGRAPAAASLLERRRALSDLGEKLAHDRDDLAKVDEEIARGRAECTQLAADLGRLDSEAHEATVALVAAEHRRDGAERERAAAETRLEEARGELVSAEEAIARAEAQAVEAATAESEAAEAIRHWELRLEEAAAARDRQREATEACAVQRDASRRELSDAREKMTEAAAVLAQREHERSVVASRRGSLAQEVSRLSTERDSATALVETLAADVEAARAELARREERVEAARSRARVAEEALALSEERLTRARRSYDEKRESASSLESRSAGLEAQIAALAGQARERHGVAIEEAVRPEDFDEAIAVERISAFKDRLAQLGDVNLAAIADARELEERYEFLSAQRRDLEASMEDLERTIGELSRTTRARFKETFEKADVKFRELFVELFHGGRATLKLTNPNNLLESGVEIEAQPPGKRVGSLGVLSGGERALTAVSLIMALFSLRTTPFCLLDEVDAPLDDANVARFNAMLRRISERTQFIIITHKQRTMETADALYGVTMAEAGVSQMVSVRIGGAREEALAATA